MNARPSLNDLLSVLNSYFGKTTFRSHQEEIIRAALQGHDLLVILPTGHGKSLTYQLPAIASSHLPQLRNQDGVTVVISPLISLMQDQVANLNKKNINAVTLNGTTPQAERDRVLHDLTNRRPRSKPPDTKLLYVSPELCGTEAFRKVLKTLVRNSHLSRFVIDEAHCCVEWGYDFRSSYIDLSYLKTHFPNVPITALSATASEKAKKQIVSILKLGTVSELKVFSTSVNRPNLHYEVQYLDSHDYTEVIIPKLVKFLKDYEERRKRAADEISSLISAEEYQGNIPAWIKDSIPKPGSVGAGIIYCRKKSTVELITEHLNDNSIGAHAYHAGLPKSHRESVLSNWVNNEPGYDVVVATVAFGMGIDKEDVRFVIHLDCPGSIESYFQATGRAGRDGKAARCVLYYSREDRNRLIALERNNKYKLGSGKRSKRRKDDSDDEIDDEETPSGLNSMIHYCENTYTCRHLILCSYFEKDVPKRPNKEWCYYACDYCKDPRELLNQSSIMAYDYD